MTQVNLNDELYREAIATLLRVAEKRRELKDEYDEARAVIEEALGDNEVGAIDGRPVVTWKTQTRRSLNQAKLRAAFPDVVEMFTDTTELRRFVPVDPEADEMVG